MFLAESNVPGEMCALREEKGMLDLIQVIVIFSIDIFRLF